MGVYGGFFGAGIGILMLAALGILGMRNINQMNALKVVFGGSKRHCGGVFCILGDGGLVLCVGDGGRRLDRWVGRCGSGALRGPKAVRAAVVAIGFGISAYLFLRR